VKITRPDASRIDDVKPLWLALYAHHSSIADWPVRTPEESWEKRRRVYADVVDEGGILLFAEEDDGTVVGLALAEQEDGGSPTWSYPKDFVAIIDLIVLPEHRGKGVGEQLMAEVEEEARRRGVAALDLMVVNTNDVAIRFYERLGFRTDLRTMRKPL
jgi:ribosomal protein S18 acetylase RimI-like enzyme